MNILIASDDNYIDKYAVTLASLCENNDNKIIVYLVYLAENTSMFSINYLRDILNNYNSELILIELGENSAFIENSQLLFSNKSFHWPLETALRLTADSTLPDDLDRILWLDGDVLVVGDISEFYCQDISGYYYSACKDRAISGRHYQEYENIGLNKNEIYVNAGVLLINLEEIRKNKAFFEDIISYAKSHKLLYVDQSIINGLYHDKIKIADENVYNCIISTYHYLRDKQLLSNVNIIHFAASRPWNPDYGKHYSSPITGDIWWRYAIKADRRNKTKYVKWKISNFILTKPWKLLYDFKTIFEK